jgi:hypothetical protein
VAILALGLGFLGALTYYGARSFTSRAADTRASEEARSFAQHSAYLATGDAFSGYLQMLRYADDPALRSKSTTGADRRAIMQAQIYLNTNKMSALAVVDRSGFILATTDPSITDLRESEAYIKTRATLSPTNSDIILPATGKPGYVEFTAPLKEPQDGTTWAILYGRADPGNLWLGTLRGTVDGGRNVIINSEGQYAAGVPDELLGQPWRGVPLANGSVRADIAGVDSICGLGSVGRDTQIDHGWNVASCLPVSLIQLEAGRAMGKQGIVTLAGAVLAVVAGGIALWLLLRDDAERTGIAAAPPLPVRDETAPTAEVVTFEPLLVEHTAFVEDDEPVPAVTVPPAVVVVADVDAVTLIQAFERRNTMVADRLRELIQARIMVAAARADEAFRIAAEDPQRAAAMHAEAIDELERLRQRDIRALSQELHPGLVRLGLAAALRALQKDLEGVIDLTFEIASNVDVADIEPGTGSIDPDLRLVLYRIVRDALTALAGAGATEAIVTAQRDGAWVELEIVSVADLAGDPLAAATIALEAYGGTLQVERTDDAVHIAASVQAPCNVAAEPADEEPVSSEPDDHLQPLAQPVAGETHEPDMAEKSAGRPVVTTFRLETPAAPELALPGVPLEPALRALALGIAGTLDLTLELDGAVDAVDEDGHALVDEALRSQLFRIVGDAAHVLAAAGASVGSLQLRRTNGDITLTITGGGIDTTESVLPAQISDGGAAIEARGGLFTVSRADDLVAISAEIPAEGAMPVRVVQLQRPPAPAQLAEDESAA